MKTRDNYVTKTEFKTAMKRIDQKFEKVDQRFEKLEYRVDKLDVKIQEQKIDMREILNEFGELVIKKIDSFRDEMNTRFDGLSEIYLTKKEFYAERAS